MNRITFPAAVALAAAALLVSPAPAQATVHEIVGQWCSGQGELDPPGISRPGSKNFAMPLNANGVVNPTPFDPPGAQPAGLLLFDFSHPAVKVQPTGVYIPIGMTPLGPLYLPQIAPDPNFPAFRHCPKLAG